MPKQSRAEWARLKRRQDILSRELAVKRSAPSGFIGRLLLVFPDDYAVGISNLGYQYVRLLFEEQGFWVDRMFLDPSLPTDRSLEEEVPPEKFDIVAISLSFESSVERLVPFLRRLRAMKRRPILILGGSVTYFNPFMVSDLVDFVLLGDGEVSVPAFVKWYLADFAGPKPPWIIEPGDISGVVAKDFGLGRPAYTSIIPAEGPFAGFYLLEIGRGCPIGCRFCVYGYTYRPVRWFDPSELEPYLNMVPEGVKTLGLVSASLSLHPKAVDLVRRFLKAGFRVVPSSLHVNESSEGLIELLAVGGLRTLTFAVEHGDPDVQVRLGKRVDAEHLRKLVSAGRKRGIRKVKLYFIMGVDGNPEGAAVAGVRFLKDAFHGENKDVEIHLSFSVFVPKPWTPFENREFPSKRRIALEVKAWRRHLSDLYLKVNVDWPSWREALKEYVISRATAEQVVDIIDGKLSYRQALGVVRSNSQWRELRHVDPYFILREEADRAVRGELPLGCVGDCSSCVIKSIRRPGWTGG